MTTGKITMNSTYTPSNTGDLTDKNMLISRYRITKFLK